MTEGSPRRERLRRLTAEAVEVYAGVCSDLERRSAEPPAPGDVFLLPSTADLGVVWVVAAVRSPAGRVLMVPADSQPFPGGGSVEISAEEPCGPLWLRSRFGVWVEPRILETAKRTGYVRRDRAAAAYRRWERAQRGDDAREGELETTVDDEDWERDVLLRARSLLLDLQAAGASRSPDADQRRRFGPSRSWVSRWGAVAATALLLLAIGWSAGRMQDGWGAPTAGDSRALTGLPMAWLSPEERTRGGGTTVELPAAASHLLLVLEVRELRPSVDYRLEVRRADDGEPVWTTLAHGTGSLELPLVVPRSMLPAGEYALSLASASDGRPVAEYRLTVEALPAP